MDLEDDEDAQIVKAQIIKEKPAVGKKLITGFFSKVKP